MRKLLNTLYVTTPETYLALDGENVVVLLGEEEKLRLPLHTIESIAYFGYKGTSPALMGACVCTASTAAANCAKSCSWA